MSLNTIKIFKNKIEVKTYPKKKEEFKDVEIHPYFWSEVELEDGLTFGDVMRACYHSADFISEAFRFNFWPFYYEMLKDLTAEDKKTEIDYISVYWRAEIYEPNFGEGERQFWFDGNASGMSSDGERYALDFMPLNQLENLPIKLDTRFDIEGLLRGSSLKLTDKPEYMTGLTKTFTLFDFLYTLFDEISWHGTPQNRDERFEEILERAKEITEGVVRTVSLEELKKRLGIDSAPTLYPDKGLDHGDVGIL